MKEAWNRLLSSQTYRGGWWAEFLVVPIWSHALVQDYLPEVQVRAWTTVSWRQLFSHWCPLMRFPDWTLSPRILGGSQENIIELPGIAKGPLEVYSPISVFCLHYLTGLILFVPWWIPASFCFQPNILANPMERNSLFTKRMPIKIWVGSRIWDLSPCSGFISLLCLGGFCPLISWPVCPPRSLGLQWIQPR